ncbi:unnamed protein product [Urochloa humidicola]
MDHTDMHELPEHLQTVEFFPQSSDIDFKLVVDLLPKQVIQDLFPFVPVFNLVKNQREFMLGIKGNQRRKERFGRLEQMNQRKPDELEQQNPTPPAAGILRRAPGKRASPAAALPWRPCSSCGSPPRLSRFMPTPSPRGRGEEREESTCGRTRTGSLPPPSPRSTSYNARRIVD